MDDDLIGGLIVFAICASIVGIAFHEAYYAGPAREKEAAIAREKARQEAEIRAVPVVNKTKTAEVGKRFQAEFHGEFFGGFQNNKRDIFIITDNQTGNAYLAITGCGVSELRTEEYSVKSGKRTGTRTRTVEE